jgi:3-oxoisoapionate decarboxylase
MKAGFSSYALPHSIGQYNVFSLLELAKNLGAKVVQYADNLPLHELSPEQLLTLKTTAQKMDIALEVGTRGITNLERYLAIAQRLAVPFVRLVIDTADHRPTPEETIALLKPFKNKFQNTNIKLGIENHDRYTAQTLEQIVLTLGTQWVGIILDTTNSLGANQTLQEILPILKPLTLNVHIKDYRIKRQDNELGFIIQGTQLGTGVLELEQLLGQFTCNAILEQWTPTQSTPEQTMQLEQIWFEQSLKILLSSVANNKQSIAKK